MKFKLLSEIPFHKHCDACFGRMKRYAIWDVDEFWDEVEYCPFCKGIDNAILYGDITDDLDPNYNDDWFEWEEEMTSDLRW